MVRYLMIRKHYMKHLLYCLYNCVQKGPSWESFISIIDGEIHMQLYLTNMSLKNACCLASSRDAECCTTLHLHSLVVKQREQSMGA